MASLSVRLHASHTHLLPVIVLVIVTLLFANLSLDPRTKPNEWIGQLLQGSLFGICCFYAPLLFNLAPKVTDKKHPKTFKFGLLMRTPYSYLFFLMRVVMISAISAVCVSLLIGTALNGKVSEPTALVMFFVPSPSSSLRTCSMKGLDLVTTLGSTLPKM
jgi:uncharacterized membrane protein